MPVSTTAKLSTADKKVLVRASGATDSTTEVLPQRYANPAVAILKGEAKGIDAYKTGVYGYSEGGVGVCGESPVYAGYFKGEVYIAGGDLTVESGNTNVDQLRVSKNIVVGGDIKLTNADVAEDFDMSAKEAVEPGTVMVFDQEGALCESQSAYDRRVAGVIAGAGGYRPGLILDKQESALNRQPVALMGKVYCKVDAQFGPVGVGDLLTSSPTPGHAMRAADPTRAFGCVIGKALRPLPTGRGLLPILVALQ